MTNLLLVDDHQIVIDGIRSIVDKHPSMKVVGEAQSSAAALDAVRTLDVDIVLMDIHMPPGADGLETTRQIKAELPDVDVLILSMSDAYETINEAAQAGVSGYLLKNAGEREVIRAIETITEGGKFFGKAATERLIEGLSRPPVPVTETNQPTFTPRETEVLALVPTGMSNKSMGRQLFIEESTVATHIRNLIAKTGVRNRTELAAWAARHGFGNES